MGTTDWRPKKPYDLRERLFEFACLIIRLVQFLHTRGPIAIELSAQVLKSGTSAAANYECDILGDEHDPLIDESDELIRIVATIIRKAEGNRSHVK
jgi:hypothetical protein